MSTTVNTALGTWSELFMLLAALVYLFVFVAFAWDMAAHSRTLRRADDQAARAAEPALQRERAQERSAQLVTAGASSSASAGEAGTRDLGGSGNRSATWRTGSDSSLDGQLADSSMDYGTSSERRPAARAAVVLMGMAFAIHAFAVVSRGFAAGRVPWANMYEFSTTGALIIAGIYLIMLTLKDLRFVGVLISGLVTLMLCLATIAYPTPVSPLQPALQSYWLIIHVSIAVLSSGIFAITFAMSVLQLLQDRRERRLRQGGEPGWGFMRVVPSAAALETFAYRLNAVGFVFWTFTLVAGAIWARDAWGRYWGWDPKEVWTFVIWVVYAAYLHARATRGWTGARSAWLSIAGFLCVLFNYFIVNTLFQGLHSYSGL